jgi:hypothetical protein
VAVSPSCRESFSVGSVIPSNVSKRYRSREWSPLASSVRATACILPPRHTPHSTIAPGILKSWTYLVALMSACSLSLLVMVKGRTARMISQYSSS